MISMNAVVSLFSKLSPVPAENHETDRLALAWQLSQWVGLYLVDLTGKTARYSPKLYRALSSHAWLWLRTQSMTSTRSQRMTWTRRRALSAVSFGLRLFSFSLPVRLCFTFLSCPFDKALCQIPSYALLQPPKLDESSHPIVNIGSSLTKYRIHRWNHYLGSSKRHILLPLAIPCRLCPPRHRDPDKVRFRSRYSERTTAERIQVPPRSDWREHAYVTTVCWHVLEGTIFVSWAVRSWRTRNSTWNHCWGQPLLRYAQWGLFSSAICVPPWEVAGAGRYGWIWSTNRTAFIDDACCFRSVCVRRDRVSRKSDGLPGNESCGGEDTMVFRLWKGGWRGWKAWGGRAWEDGREGQERGVSIIRFSCVRSRWSELGVSTKGGILAGATSWQIAGWDRMSMFIIQKGSTSRYSNDRRTCRLGGRPILYHLYWVSEPPILYLLTTKCRYELCTIIVWKTFYEIVVVTMDLEWRNSAVRTTNIRVAHVSIQSIDIASPCVRNTYRMPSGLDRLEARIWCPRQDIKARCQVERCHWLNGTLPLPQIRNWSSESPAADESCHTIVKRIITKVATPWASKVHITFLAY